MSCKEYLKELHIRVEQSKARGRFLVAEKAIPAGRRVCSVLDAGTTIMTCNPLSFAVTNDKQAFVCQNCLKEYPKLMACGKCGYAHYCCRECQVQDWSD